MNDTGNESFSANDDAIEALLGKAAPREAPPADDAAIVRAAVQAEWRKVSGRRQRQRRAVQMAIAASVLVAAFLSLDLLRTGGIEPVSVASIDKQFGSVRITGATSPRNEETQWSTVVAGDAIVTGAASGVSLAWEGGGSLRVDAGTRLEIRSQTEIYLSSGRVYYDSTPALAAITGGGRLVIDTDFGEVTHVGTQFMVHKDRSELSVSVRSGIVEVTTDGGMPARATDSQRLSVRGGAHEIVNFRPWGDAWEWLEATSPSVGLEGRSIDEFLGWVGHETGMTVRYGSDDARSAARREILKGRDLDASPRDALALWMRTTDLDWHIDEGVIYVEEQ